VPCRWSCLYLFWCSFPGGLEAVLGGYLGCISGLVPVLHSFLATCLFLRAIDAGVPVSACILEYRVVFSTDPAVLPFVHFCSTILPPTVSVLVMMHFCSDDAIHRLFSPGGDGSITTVHSAFILPPLRLYHVILHFISTISTFFVFYHSDDTTIPVRFISVPTKFYRFGTIPFHFRYRYSYHHFLRYQMRYRTVSVPF